MIVAIVFETIDKANKYLHDFVGEMKFKEVKALYKKGARLTCETSNGNLYTVLPCDENAIRGYKFDQLVVSKNVDKSFVHFCMPCFTDFVPSEARVIYVESQ